MSSQYLYEQYRPTNDARYNQHGYSKRPSNANSLPHLGTFSNNYNKPSDYDVYDDNDYSNNYVHSNNLPVQYVRNISTPVDGYPKLQKLFNLKEQSVQRYSTKPYGCRVESEKIVSTLNNWISNDYLQFDVIMIGALVENQFILPILTQLPIHKLCSKPGFLFIWASTQKIQELTQLLNSDGWGKKFRRSEELVFVPVDKNSPFHPNKDSCDDLNENSVFEKMQWHCWMCITGTVRRSTDSHLIHCNVDTDLHIENDTTPSCVPSHLYRVAENFSSATRRLHIIPSRTGYNHPVRLRPGWVILSPDVMLDNFEPTAYKNDIAMLGPNIPESKPIEELRPKSPVAKN